MAGRGRVWGGGIPGDIREEKIRSGTHSGSGRKLTLEEDAGGEGPQLKMKSGTWLGKKSETDPKSTGKPLAQ